MRYDHITNLVLVVIFLILIPIISGWKFSNVAKTRNLMLGLLSNIFGGFLTLLVIPMSMLQANAGLATAFICLAALVISLTNQIVASYLFKRKGNAWASLGVWLIYPLAIVWLSANYIF